MRIDVTECAEFQELRPPYLATVSYVEVEESVLTYFFDNTDRMRSLSFNIGYDDKSIPKGDRFWKEMNVLKKHYPEAFI